VSERNWFESNLRALSITLTDKQAEQLIGFLDELLSWNKKINLTAIVDRREAIEKHLIDSLTLAPWVGERGRLLDVGSGAGLPGIPLKIAIPTIDVTMVDSVQKKILFQRHVCRVLGLTGITSWHGRVEDLPKEPGCSQGYDVVVSRAFASLQSFIHLASPCLALSGKIVAMKGPEAKAELEDCRAELVKKGIVCTEQKELQLPVTGSKRTILVFENAETPHM